MCCKVIQYKIRRVESSKDNDFIKALSIYSEHIDMRILTLPREIVFWIDNYSNKSKLKKKHNEFFVFVLYINDEVVGYVQLVYFSEHSFVFIDYIAIKKEYRSRSFFEFTHQIKQYFQNHEIYYYVTEIPIFEDSDSKPSIYNKSLLKLVSLLGFQIIPIPYKQPELGCIIHGSEINGKLVICSSTNNTIPSIPKQTLTNILETIYFEHYAFWYKEVIKDESTYNRYYAYLQRLFQMYSILEHQSDPILLTSHSSSFHIVDDEPPALFPKLPTIIGTAIIFVLSLLIMVFLYNKPENNLIVFFGVPTLFAIITYILLCCIFKDKTLFPLLKRLIIWGKNLQHK